MRFFKGTRPRIFVALAAATVALVAFASVGYALTQAKADGSWERFVSSGSIGQPSVAGPYTFTTTNVARVTVTDAFCKGDEFRVSDNGKLLGDTTDVASEWPACVDSAIKYIFLPPDAAAKAAINDPGQSHGVWYVGPGEHSLEFEAKALWASELGVGSGAFFKVENVTLTKADCKDGGWTTYGQLFANQGDCVSFIATDGKNLPSGG